MSHRLLTANEIDLLSLSLNFPSSPTPISMFNVRDQFLAFRRSVRLDYNFGFNDIHNEEFNLHLYVKNPDYQPQDADLTTEYGLKAIDITLKGVINLPRNWTNNLTDYLKLAVYSLELDNSIKILDSDKNLGPVVVDTTWYNEQCFLHLTDESTYKEVTIEFFESSIFNAQAKLKSLIDKYEHLLQDGSLPDKHREFLFSQFCSPLPAGFRILPKIHKTPVQIRPIVCSKQFCVSPCSVFLDERLKDILSGLPYILKNSTALLESLNSLVIDQSCILVTGDLKPLYTNISVQDAIVAVDSIRREFKIKETPFLIQLVIVETCFDEQFYLLFGVR